MRNKIIHDYEHVDMAVLWGTITKSLPVLISQVEKVLSQQAANIDYDENNSITEEEKEKMKGPTLDM